MAAIATGTTSALRSSSDAIPSTTGVKTATVATSGTSARAGNSVRAARSRSRIGGRVSKYAATATAAVIAANTMSGHPPPWYVPATSEVQSSTSANAVAPNAHASSAAAVRPNLGEGYVHAASASSAQNASALVIAAIQPKSARVSAPDLSMGHPTKYHPTESAASARSAMSSQGTAAASDAVARLGTKRLKPNTESPVVRTPRYEK